MDYIDHQHIQAWTNAFNAWERPGRGWDLWDVAVELEPLFRRIATEAPPQRQVTDDARTSGGIRGLLTRSSVPRGAAAREVSLIPSDLSAVRPPAYYRTDPITELLLQLPRKLDVNANVAEQSLLSLGHFPEPVAFEIYGDGTATSIQLTCSDTVATHITTQWKTIMPTVTIAPRDGFLKTQFERPLPTAIADFALSSSFLLPLREFRNFDPDPLGALIGSFGPLTTDDRAAFQVLFVPARSPWCDTLRAVQSDPEQRKMLNELNPGYAASVKEKFSTPLFATSVRLIVQSTTLERSWTLLRQIGGSLRQFSNPRSNELIALDSDGYNQNDHLLSFFSRTNYRSGFLLNTSELASLVHLPSSSVRTEKLTRSASKTKAIPELATGHSLTLGENIHDGLKRLATLSDEQRTRHIHIIGSTGSGKSTLLLNCISQDLQAGKGLCVIDPAGDLIDAVCANMPDSRLDDAILFDPSDTEFPIGFNVMQAHSDLEKTLIASDLVAAFRRMATSWGDVMDATLANAVLAILESDRGGTLLDLKRFLVEKSFRDEFLNSVIDDNVRYFWTHEFPLVAGKPQASILIRLDQFLRQRIIRHIVCQKDNKLDFRSIMDDRKILLVKLSQGMIGVENAHLLGTLIVTKLHQIALSRQDTTTRPFFAIYLDEFHNFVGPSIEPILSGIRKYNISLSLSHQGFRQVQSQSQEVAASVIANCYTRICFRLGDADADRFAGGYSYFDAADLQNLGIGEAIARVERADNDFNLLTSDPGKIDDTRLEAKRSKLRDLSRARYAISRSAAEEEASRMRKPTFTMKPAVPPPEPSTTYARSSKVKSMEPNDGNASEHQYLQKIVKRIAEKYGFIATVEKQVFGGIGRIDVALENGAIKVACEVAVTNTVEYEVQSIQKCLGSGYDRVIVLSVNEQHLNEIEGLASSTIGADQIGCVAFLKPDDFHLYLERLCSDDPDVSGDVKVKGYKIHTSYADATPSAAELIKDTIADILGSEVSK
ncbi:MAG: type IV secretion system DNA-binding domain-containing protein [Pyrinomonadaceae bacterium]